MIGRSGEFDAAESVRRAAEYLDQSCDLYHAAMLRRLGKRVQELEHECHASMQEIAALRQGGAIAALERVLDAMVESTDGDDFVHEEYQNGMAHCEELIKGEIARLKEGQ